MLLIEKNKSTHLVLLNRFSKMFYHTVVIGSPQRTCAGVMTGGRHRGPSPTGGKSGADTAEGNSGTQNYLQMSQKHTVRLTIKSFTLQTVKK